MENITFEQAMNRLEEIVSALENNHNIIRKKVLNYFKKAFN